jgi:hypothetical protein
MTKITYRQPSGEELELLMRMLDANFTGAEELKCQLSGILVRALDEESDNYGSIALKVADCNPVIVEKRVPVVARAYDSDGTPVEALLHIVEGRLNELEVIKFDGTPILNKPKSSEYLISLE